MTDAEQMRDDIRDFLRALDRGCFGGDVILALEDSAFVDALREHVKREPTQAKEPQCESTS